MHKLQISKCDLTGFLPPGVALLLKGAGSRGRTVSAEREAERSGTLFKPRLDPPILFLVFKKDRKSLYEAIVYFVQPLDSRYNLPIKKAGQVVVSALMSL